MIDRKLLKANARARMAQSEPRYWKVMLVWVLAAVVVPSIISSFVPNPVEQYATMVSGGLDPYMAMAVFNGGAVTIGLFLGIVITLFQIVMGFGLTHYALKLYRGEECGTRSLFDGFSLVGRVIGAQLLVVLFIFLWSMLLMIPFAAILGLGVYLEGAVGILLFIVGTIAYCVGVAAISLRYSLTTLALADDPEVGALGAIQRSKDLMRGRKWQFFVMSLSFLGWVILCGLLAGIITGLTTAGTRLGFSGLTTLPAIVTTLLMAVAELPIYLWLEPYVQLTYAGFYDALCPRQGTGFEPLEERPFF